MFYQPNSVTDASPSPEEDLERPYPIPGIVVFNIGKTERKRLDTGPEWEAVRPYHQLLLEALIKMLRKTQAKKYTVQGVSVSAGAQIVIDTDDEDWANFVDCN